ncbi:MAG: hypothetical protein K8S98_13575 [Planctomycetes bacterium]|nr:hypothetical protein [Planctomycetota bacterium]
MNVARFGPAALALLGACHGAPPTRPEPSNAVQTPSASAVEPADTMLDLGGVEPDLAPTGNAESIVPAGPEAPAPTAAPARVPELVRSPDELGEAAKDAIDAGDFAHARDLVEQLIVGSRLQEGVRLLASGRALDAVAVLEDVRREAPGRQDALIPFAEASLQAGKQLNEPALLERALAAFGQVENEPAAALGASRAAAALGRTDEALRFAREGLRRIEVRGPSTLVLAEAPERTYAQAALDAFQLARANQSAEADGLRVEAEDALARYLGTNSQDGWIWLQLGALASADGRLPESRAAYQRGLARESNNAALLDGLWRVSYADGGFTNASTVMSALLTAHPELARARFDLGLARFELALAHLDATTVPEFETAQREFRAAREADASLETDGLGWQAMCRAGIGWSKLAASDLAGARAAFESMESLFAGGMRWRIEGRLRSGVEGLEAVGAAFQRSNALADAAECFDRLAEYEPTEMRFANNAGFFNRDLAVQIAGTADDLERAARGEIQDPSRLAELRVAAGLAREGAVDAAAKRAFEHAAQQARDAAGRFFEKSFAAYEKALALAPDDVRLQNDTALMLVYYLHRDWDRARSLLETAIEQGEKQLADTTLADDARSALQNAWGDAHENFGVLALEHDRDAAAARRWFQRAVEIGPDPRPIITDHWLKKCDELEAAH